MCIIKRYKMVLKEMRQKHRYTQDAIAKALGIAKNTYFQYENGLRKVPTSILEKLADIYGCSVDRLLGRVQEQQLFDDARVPKSELLEIFEQLNPSQKEQLLIYARGMIDANRLSDKH